MRQNPQTYAIWPVGPNYCVSQEHAEITLRLWRRSDKTLRWEKTKTTMTFHDKDVEPSQIGFCIWEFLRRREEAKLHQQGGKKGGRPKKVKP